MKLLHSSRGGGFKPLKPPLGSATGLPIFFVLHRKFHTSLCTIFFELESDTLPNAPNFTQTLPRLALHTNLTPTPATFLSNLKAKNTQTLSSLFPNTSAVSYHRLLLIRKTEWPYSCPRSDIINLWGSSFPITSAVVVKTTWQFSNFASLHSKMFLCTHTMPSLESYTILFLVISSSKQDLTHR